MNFIDPNSSSTPQVNQADSIMKLSRTQNASDKGFKFNQIFANDPACSFNGLDGKIANFDMISDKIALFKDIICTAQCGVSAMKEQGESIRALVEQAQQEGITPEILDRIQAEVDTRVAEIDKIKNSTNYNRVNIFENNFHLDIPDWRTLIGANDKEEAKNAITDMMASFDIDINIEGDGFKIGGSAKIEIGYTEDGALQINVDASMDYDLSGLVGKGGVTSDGAFDIINNFINMLGVQQGDLGNANYLMDAIFEQIFNNMNNPENLPDGIDFSDDSTSIIGHMVQQASITLDGMAGQVPNIALNIL